MTRADLLDLDRERLATLRELGEPDGDAFVADLAATFVVDAATHLAAIRAALAAADPAALTEAAHTLKGCCANLGAVAMADTAHALELIGRAGGVEGTAALAAELEARFTRARALLLDHPEGGAAPPAG